LHLLLECAELLTLKLKITLMELSEIKELLDKKYNQFNTFEFIETDPIQIPKLFSDEKNIEISGFLASTIAWGNRKMIIKNSLKLIELMGNSPIDFVLNHSTKDLNKLSEFKHRTFNGEDCQFFIKSLKNIYQNHNGIKSIFENSFNKHQNIKPTIAEFRQIFFEIDHKQRTTKHIANIEKNSAAKRINMFLRWMVRNDNKGVDFGLWNIPASALMIPLDVHSGNVSRKLGLLKRTPNDWTAVEELTNNLKLFDPTDPIKYDFALFGMGVFDKF